MNKRKPPVIAIILIILLICLLIFLRLFPNFSFSSLIPQKETAVENKPDTQAPVITCDIKSKTIKAGDTISVSKLGIRVTDNSQIDSLLFTKIQSDHFYAGSIQENSDTIQAMKQAYAEGIAFSGEEFQFSYGGIYELTITATDIYANSSDFTFTLKVETPPIIETPSDYYVVSGTEIPFDAHIKAWDVVDGDISFEDLTLDTSNLQIKTDGSYPIYVTATDNYGLQTTHTINVHVMSKAAIQELIDTQKINATDHAIIGADNKYDIGRYDDPALLETAITPALVQISNEKNNTVGDGFIIKIDDAFITITTKAATVADSLTAQVDFFDHTTCHGSVVFTNSEYDLAFIRIPIDGADEKSSVSSDHVSSLRTVHLDETQWKIHPVTKQVSLAQMLRHYELVFKHKLAF